MSPPPIVTFLPMVPVMVTCPPAILASWATVPDIDHFGPRYDDIAVHDAVYQDIPAGGIEIAIDDAGYFYMRTKGEVVALNDLTGLQDSPITEGRPRRRLIGKGQG